MRPATEWDMVGLIRRRRELRRAGRAARRLIAADARRILSEHWYLFMGVLVAPLVTYGLLDAGWTYLLPRSGFQRGFSWGLMVGLSIAAMLLLLASFNLDRRLMGADAERWSTSELLKLEKHGWRLINDVPTDFGNIDHVLVGQQAVLAVETKLIDETPWTDDAIQRACEQARRGAKRIGLVLRQAGIDELRVIPVVFRWGVGVRKEPPVRHEDDVRILSAGHNRRWRRHLVKHLPSTGAHPQAVTKIAEYAKPLRRG